MLFVLLFAVAFLSPLGAGIWAYTRSSRGPLLAIPLVLFLLPLLGAVGFAVAGDAGGVQSPFWAQRTPGLIALLVVVVLVRRLEQEDS